MNVPRLSFFQYDFPNSEEEASECFEEVAKTILACSNKTSFPSKTAIYLFSPDAGVQYSVGLWKNALEHGPDFANPRNFPWTLASCPASTLARHLKANGPNTTLIGGLENLPQIQELLELHASQGLIEVAIIVCLNNNWQGLTSTPGFCKGVILSIDKNLDLDLIFIEIKEYLERD